MEIVQPGDIVAGKYVVEHVLGRGGAGVVFAAHHVALDRRVALKFLRPEVAAADPASVKRFLREAQVCAQMRSEHIAQVMDTGTLESGVPFIVMEHLDGSDLAEVLSERGPLPVSDAVEYMMQVCEALAEAHALKIVHRDLKPSNIFLTHASDGSPLLKVIDFGLSKFQDRLLSEALTLRGVVGTPQFMAPEQLRSSQAADARSDIWALGVVLFNLIAGRAPFEGRFSMEVFGAILDGNIPSLRALRSDVPEGLEAVVRRCLRLDPTERFASVSELAAALVPFAPCGGARAARAARIVERTAQRPMARPRFAGATRSPASSARLHSSRASHPYQEISA